MNEKVTIIRETIHISQKKTDFSDVKDSESWIAKRNELHIKLGKARDKLDRILIREDLRELTRIRNRIIFPPERAEDPNFFDNW